MSAALPPQGAEFVQNTEGLMGSADPYQITPYGPKPEEKKDSPPILDTLGAAFRTASPVGSALNYLLKEQSFTPDDGYNVFDDIRGTDYAADYAGKFIGVFSRAEAAQVKSRIDKEKADARLLASAGWSGTVAMIGMGLIDPTIILPGGALYKGAKSGYSAGRSALSVGAAAGVQSGISEAILQSTQLTRELDDIPKSIAIGTILGGILGAGAAAFMTKAELRASEIAVRRFAGDDAAAGAARVDADVSATLGRSDRPVFDAGSTTVDDMVLPQGGRAQAMRAADDVVLGEAGITARALDNVVLPEAIPAPFSPQVQRVADDVAALQQNGGSGFATSAGAAASDLRTGELKSAFGLESFGAGISPTRFAIASSFKSARLFMLDIAETGMRTIDTYNGIAKTNGPPLSRLVNNFQDEASVLMRKSIDDQHAKYFSAASNGQVGFADQTVNSFRGSMLGQDTGKMTVEQFRERVGRAMVNGDQDAIPEVAAVAKAVRENIIEPWFNAAKESGLLPKDTTVRNAISYFPVSYNREVLIAKPAEFIGRFADWLQSEQIRKADTKIRVAQIDKERVAATKAIDTIEQKIERLNASSGKVDARLSERDMDSTGQAQRMKSSAARIADLAESESQVAEAIAALKQQMPGARDALDAAERRYARASKIEQSSSASLADLQRASDQEVGAMSQKLTRVSEQDDASGYAMKIMLGKRRGQEPYSLIDYIADNGGISPGLFGGELKNIQDSSGRRVVKKGGKSVDGWGEQFGQLQGRVGAERMTEAEIIQLIEDAKSGKNPWWLEKEVPESRRISSEGAQIANEWKEAAQQVGIKLDDRKTLARWFFETADEAVVAPAAEGIAASGSRDAAGAAIDKARASAAELRRVIAQAGKKEAGLEKSKASVEGRLKEAEYAAAKSEARAQVLVERQAAGQDRLQALNDLRQIAEDARRSAITRLEKELEQWGGKSTDEALSKVKKRDGKTVVDEPAPLESFSRDEALSDAENATRKAIFESKQRAAERAKLSAPAKPSASSADDAIILATKRIQDNPLDYTRVELEARAGEVRDRLISGPEGRLPYDEGGGPKAGQGAIGDEARGPLAARENMFPHAEMIDAGFAHSDVEHVMSQFIRTIIPDVTMHARYNGDLTGANALKALNEERTARLVGLSEKDAIALNRESERVKSRIIGTINRIRGIPISSSDVTSGANVARVASIVKDYTRGVTLGGAGFSSLAEPFVPVLRYNLETVFSDGWKPYFAALSDKSHGANILKDEMHALGIGLETSLALRAQAADEIGGVYKPTSRVERALKWAGSQLQVVNLQAPLTDFNTMISAFVMNANILREAENITNGSVNPKFMRAFLDSGIDQDMAKRIHAAFLDGGGTISPEGTRLPNLKDWKDAGARQAYAGMLKGEIDKMVVKPGLEKPLLMSDPVGGVILNLKSFTAGNYERVILSNLQDYEASKITGLLMMLGGGMASVYATNAFAGRKQPERPQDWIKEGMMKAGVLGWFDEANQMSARLTSGKVDYYRLIGADKPLTQRASQSTFSQVAGPSFGLIEKMQSIVSAPFSEEGWSARNTNQARQMVYLQNLWALRLALNQVEDSVNRTMGIAPLVRP